VSALTKSESLRYEEYAKRTYHRASKEFRNKNDWVAERQRYFTYVRQETTEMLEWLTYMHNEHLLPRGEDTMEVILDELSERLLLGKS
jgi:hypothetical protein